MSKRVRPPCRRFHKRGALCPGQVGPQVTRSLTLAEEREVGLLRREIGRVGEEMAARAEAEAQRARIEAEWRPSGTVGGARLPRNTPTAAPRAARARCFPAVIINSGGCDRVHARARACACVCSRACVGARA